jgi:hypothetical protein
MSKRLLLLLVLVACVLAACQPRRYSINILASPALMADAEAPDVRIREAAQLAR